jgi:hypothetical protein
MIGRLALAVALCLVGAGPAPAQAPSPRCPGYAAAWAAAQARFGLQGIGAGFIDAHEAFLASGCRRRAAICPQGEAETRLADAMTIAAMNAGAASSFVPFRCPG